MIILLDTTTPICKLSLVEDELRVDDAWEANRELAKGLLGYLEQQLRAQHASWKNVTGLVVLKGPGSFTGLRIGLTVMNTLADSLNIPIVGEVGEAWQQQGLHRLARGENDHLVMPEYGGEAHITTPRK